MIELFNRTRDHVVGAVDSAKVLADAIASLPAAKASLVAWVLDNRGRTIAYLVIALFLLTPAALVITVLAGRCPVPLEWPEFCSRTLC